MTPEEIYMEGETGGPYTVIMPAEGWLAVFTKAEQPWWWSFPLSGWALTMDGDAVGLVAFDRVKNAEALPNFLTYANEMYVTPESEIRWAAAGRQRHDQPRSGVVVQLIPRRGLELVRGG